LSIPEQIRSLEDLAAIDAELKILDEQLNQERSTLTTLKGNLKRLEEKLKNDTMSVAATEKARNELVTDVRTMMQQLEHSRDKLNRSRTERETNAAQRELEELRKLVRDREEDITKLTSEGDSVRAQIDATNVDVKKLQEELGSSEGDINSTLTRIENEMKGKVTQREAIQKQLPSILYRRYDMIRGKKGTGIAQTSDGTCKACNMSLPPQLFHRLRREPMIEQCPSCQRLIYFVPPTPPSSSSES
jgi:predicted  nucleic acid-binding Zn-ribbon protein